MKKFHFERTFLEGAWLIKSKPHMDERGQMIRTFCQTEFLEQGIEFNIAQSNVSINKHKGTLRGMHCQVVPEAESKIVRCIRGSLYDVIVDMRPYSPTYLQHFAVELTEFKPEMLLIPKDFMHGFLTLEDNTELEYMVNNSYAPAYGRGVRYSDPALSIKWPIPVNVISEQDKSWPLLDCGAS